MPRRRSRLFTVIAIVIVILLYRVLQNSWDAQQPRTAPIEPLRQPPVGRPPINDATAPKPGDDVRDAYPPRPSPLKDNAIASGEKLAQEPVAQEANGDESTAPKSSPQDGNKLQGVTKGAEGKPDTANAKSDDKIKPAQFESSQIENVQKPIDGQQHQSPPVQQVPMHGDDDFDGMRPAPTKVTWKKPKEHFPVPKESIITLPTGKAQKMPRIQHIFAPESEVSKNKRLERQKQVRTELERSWSAYRKYAWMHDELSPVSKSFRDPFCGWAATLVDSLDTLWIAGLKDEFDEAANAVKDIDFTYTERSQIPVFETTIRYLGGLIAAYDVSGGASGRYGFLLNKAVDLAEILMGIFDTPNRMPIMYYSWQPSFTSQPHMAGRAGMAELATLSLEFTRLAQLTGQHKFYDAIDRITDGLIVMQKEGTLVTGLFPEALDVSGCNRTAAQERQYLSIAAQRQLEALRGLEEPKGYADISSNTAGSSSPSDATDSRKERPAVVDDRLHRRANDFSQQRPDTVLGKPKPDKMQSSYKKNSQYPIAANGLDSEFDCDHQGFVPSKGEVYQNFHMGGGQDSAYEYFAKEYLLLAGKEPKYQKLYEDTVESVNEHLLFRPMTEGNWDVLFPAKLSISATEGSMPDLDYEVTHLTCFIGGMYGLGGRLFGREEDVEYAKKLTDGCVWAYQSTATGIMPEYAHVLPCPSMDKCSFDEKLWLESLDPKAATRDEEVRMWEASHQEADFMDGQLHDFSAKQHLVGDSHSVPKAPQYGGLEGSVQDRMASNSAAGTETHDSAKLQKRAAIPNEGQDMGHGFKPLAAEAPSGLNDFDDGRLDGEVPRSDASTGSADSLVGKEAHASNPNPQKLKDHVVEDAAPSVPDHRVGSLKNHYTNLQKPLTHQEFVDKQIKEGVPRGFTKIQSKKYILRPEAIESVWYMYRITGDPVWMDKGWDMWQATIKATRAVTASSAISNVLNTTESHTDEMESFWIAETLKYYYLLFSEPSLVSLDEWVLNTEAHPFKLQ